MHKNMTTLASNYFSTKAASYVCCFPIIYTTFLLVFKLISLTLIHSILEHLTLLGIIQILDMNDENNIVKQVTKTIKECYNFLVHNESISTLTNSHSTTTYQNLKLIFLL